ncbi:hypothetical protein ACP70R_032967 [Stipagrostis hirtigluma subsp. patula]
MGFTTPPSLSSQRQPRDRTQETPSSAPPHASGDHGRHRRRPPPPAPPCAAAAPVSPVVHRASLPSLGHRRRRRRPPGRAPRAPLAASGAVPAPPLHEQGMCVSDAMATSPGDAMSETGHRQFCQYPSRQPPCATLLTPGAVPDPLLLKQGGCAATADTNDRMPDDAQSEDIWPGNFHADFRLVDV